MLVTMPLSLCQQLRKALLISSSFVCCFILWQSWSRFSLSPRFAAAVPSTSAKSQLDLTVLEDFPKRIWTTGPLSPMRIKKDDADRVRTWMDLNPEHRYELLTDGGAETYVKDHFPLDSRISKTYLSLSDYIMRADLIRYLALLQDGGVYNDVDVGCLKPIDLWIPPAFRHNTSVVLGIEVDNEMGPDRSKLFELVNWTIMSRRNAPFMRYLVDRVIENLENNAAKHNTTLSSLQPKRQEVIDVTGPAALTQAAFQYLSEKTQTTVDMQNFTKMRRPKLVADILVLPINAFGAGHQVQWSGTDEDGSALVHHYFAGSWKTNHFDGPTEEEKKAAEEKKKEEDRKRKEEEDRKKKEEEDKKIKEESEKKKAEEERRKKEEDEKRKAELEQKSREEAEANKQKVTIENQSSEQGHKDGQGQVQQEQQSDQEPQEGEDQQSGVEQQDGQEQENGDEHEAGEEEQQNTKPAGQPGPDPHAGQTQGKEAKAESSKEEEKLSISVVQQERQRAIEELNRVNAVRRKTREEAIKKIVADRKKDVEERKKDEENKKKLAELEERKSKQQAPVANTQTAADQGQAQSASKEQAQSNAPAQQHASKP